MSKAFQVTTKRITPKHQYVFVNGVYAGTVHKEGRSYAQGCGNRTYSYDWTGELTYDGVIVHLGPTSRVDRIAPKCEGLLRSALTRREQVAA